MQLWFQRIYRLKIVKIKKLESKISKNKDIINSKNKYSNTDYSQLEQKQKNLENRLTALEEENKEKNRLINSFLNDMNDMLQMHEQKCKFFIIYFSGWFTTRRFF